MKQRAWIGCARLGWSGLADPCCCTSHDHERWPASCAQALGVAELTAIALSVADGCEYLESRKVVHRALQGQAILVGKDHTEIYIGGLGSMRDVSQYDEYVRIPACCAHGPPAGVCLRSVFVFVNCPPSAGSQVFGGLPLA